MEEKKECNHREQEKMAKVDKYRVQEHTLKSLEEIASLPKNLPLHELQVFILYTSTIRDQLWEVKRFLSHEEKKRAEKFFSEKDADLFIAAHGVLRKILSHYLSISPREIFFSTLPGGKPFLSAHYHNQPILFNISHSGEVAAIALSMEVEVGIDIETVCPFVNFMEIAENFFHPQETNKILTVPDKRRLQKFYEIWTQKEAVLKTLGTGLATPLDQFNVTEIYGRWSMVSLTISQETNYIFSKKLHWRKDYCGAISFRLPF